MKHKRQIVYGKYSGRCAYCGVAIAIKDMQIDHIVPKERGGGDEIKNLNPACRPCNFYKSSHTLEGFREQLGLLVWRLQERQFIYRMAKRYKQIQETTKPIKFWFELVPRLSREEIDLIKIIHNV